MAYHNTPDTGKTLEFCRSNRDRCKFKIFDVTDVNGVFGVGAINFITTSLEIEYPMGILSATVNNIDIGWIDTTIWYIGLEDNKPINLLGLKCPLKHGWLVQEKENQ